MVARHLVASQQAPGPRGLERWAPSADLHVLRKPHDVDRFLAAAMSVRASLLLVRAFAEQCRRIPQRGRVVLFSSGQHLGAMPNEIPLRGDEGRPAADDAHAGRRVVRARDHGQLPQPGPTDTGWATPEHATFIARHMPRGRWNTPEEAADVVALFLAPHAATSTG